MFLVIVFSLLHGIVFLPILLTVVMPRTNSNDGDHRTDKVNDKNYTGNRIQVDDEPSLSAADDGVIETASELSVECAGAPEQMPPSMVVDMKDVGVMTDHVEIYNCRLFSDPPD